MSHPLRFPDAHAAQDAVTFAGRAATMGDGVVRLQARDGVLVMTAAPLAPRGLLDATPTVLGMRMLPIDPELECDLAVDAVRLTLDGTADVLLPETAVSPAWAGVSPPRTGWEREGALASDLLADLARRGSDEVATALPASPGEDAVRTVRAAVWGRPEEALGELPAGVAFAAHGLGFLAASEPVSVWTAAGWRRLTLARGHVLSRRPPREGLTPVRTTRADRSG